MVGALGLSVHLTRPASPIIDRYYLLVFVLALTFYPLYRATLGGQNTALTLLLIVLAWRASIANHQWLAGICLGLLLYKPQFALPLIGLYLLSGHLRVVLWSTLSALVLYGISAIMLGYDWIIKWLQFSYWFTNLDAAVNSANSISCLGFLQAVLGNENILALSLGLATTFVIVIALSWAWWNPNIDLTSKMGLAATGIVFISPHALYYDMGLTVFTYMTLLNERLRKGIYLIALVCVCGISQVASGILGFSPLFFLLLFTGVLAIRAFRGQSESADSRSPDAAPRRIKSPVSSISESG
jgi:hypothetical protein